MVVQYSDPVLDNISTGLSTFDPGPCPELLARTPLIEILIKLGLAETLFVKRKPLHARALRQALRRMAAAGHFYSEMRTWLNVYKETSRPGSPNFVAFFSALNAAEMCILNFYAATGSVNFLDGRDNAESNDKVINSIRSLAESIKHSDGQAKSDKQSNRLTMLPVYFNNLGLKNWKAEVSFLDLHNRYETISDWITEFASEITRTNPLDPIMKFRYSSASDHQA